MSQRLVLTGLLAVLLLSGCSSPAPKTAAGAHADSAAAANFKIGIMTGTVSQGEEDFRGGQQVQAKYGDRVKLVTYPDNFMNEQETVIAQLAGLAADPATKVICVCQAVPGSVAAARKIRESRPDILIGFVNPHEDPDVVNQACDIAIRADELERGHTIIENAAKMGAKHFIHYSFPRHMSQLLMAQRRDIMKAECEKRGIQFHFVTAPDPMGEGGLPASQQFILEDVPREVGKYGKQTAFYTTNDGMQEPLIKAILANGGLFVEQDVPAPTAGYPAALGMAIPPEKAGDMDWINGEIKRLLAAKGASGRFGSWVAPIDMVALRAMATLLVDSVAKKADFRDSTTVQRYLSAECNNSPVRLRKYDAKGNQYLVILDHITY